MNWDYAKLSHAAKEAGGPEKLVDGIITISKKSGRQEMIPVVAVSSVIFGFVGILIGKKSQKKKEQELEEFKKDLIDGINDYDNNHQTIDEQQQYMVYCFND